MAKRWRKNGKRIRNAEGKRIRCDECPCGGEAIETACCENATPATLTVEGTTGAVNGLTGTLTYDSGSAKWVGTLDGHTLRVHCNGTRWNWDAPDFGITDQVFEVTEQCDPLLLEFGFIPGGSGGGFRVTE